PHAPLSQHLTLLRYAVDVCLPRRASGRLVTVAHPKSPLPARRRRRDRHGRGLRGPRLPPTLPGWRTRAEQFDELVLAVVERLERQVGAELDGVEFAVEAVPPSDPADRTSVV